MRYSVKIIGFVFILILLGCNQGSERPIDFVDPMIGTDGTGHTFPGATTPFGMVQLSPSNDFKGWAWCSGYHYSDSILKGFAHNHISGAGLSGLGDILLMPTVGKPIVNSGSEELPETGYRSRFSHENESASPGYYRVFLKDYNITVELTASSRVGFHRYIFSDSEEGNVIIDPTHGLDESIIRTDLEFISASELRGCKYSAGDDGLNTVYFYAKFSEPSIKRGIAVNDVIDQNKSEASSENTKAFLSFNMDENESIEVKVAISHVSYEGAKKNYDAEAKGVDFDKALMRARNMWKEKLNKFQIKGLNKRDESVFYTSLYHSFISPNLISDVDGRYVIDGEQSQSDEPHYSNFSTWDTYRALHPLFCIVEHEHNKRFVNSLSSRHHKQNVGLPIWELLGYDNKCMIGYNAVAPMVEAVLKDIQGIDPEEVYEAVKSAANNTSVEKSSIVYGRNGMKKYKKLHYVPAEVNASVSKTTEQNYYDWAIARLAKKLGKTEDANLFKARSLGYRNLFRADKELLWPKYASRKWREMDSTRWYDYEMNYVSGNAWGYSSYVPHDIEGLVDLIGGRDAFGKWLDKIFTDTTQLGGAPHVDISGFIGKYGHGDEPSHHMPYLYNHALQPWKGQVLVRKIMNDFYTDKPDGLVNNEDLGQMSAWYIFSALGFYPVNPAALVYEIGSPKVEEATINLENGKTFKVVAHNNNKQNVYIQSAILNGKRLEKTYITHSQIMNGGKLEFVMDKEPNKNWANYSAASSKSKVQLEDKSKIAQVLPAPYDSNEKSVFHDKLKIRLSCKDRDPQIYYTLNGTDPNSGSKRYTEPFYLTKTTRLKAIAIDEKQNRGIPMDRSYYKTIDLNGNDSDVEVSLAAAPVSGHETGQNLVDGELETTYQGDKNWSVWNGNDMELLIDFGKKKIIESLTASYLDHTVLWIFPPKAIRVYTSTDGQDFNCIARKEEISSSPTFNPFIKRPSLKFSPVQTRFLKVEMENYGEIPKWHKGGGQSARLYVGEIFVN